MTTTKPKIFTPYQAFMIAIIAILQFTIILDFMVISPLGVVLMKDLAIKPHHFGWVVSAYAYSAGISGFLAAGFADKFDRKRLLMFFYTGFLVGTVFCALANDYHFLLIARIVTGIFGGVIGSITMAIVTDLFAMEKRGRVMGFVQMAFGASQALGIPIGLVLTQYFDWHTPFWMIAGFGIVLGVIILIYMKPVVAHLHLKSDRNPFVHLANIITNRQYLVAFGATALLATGGFMMMPFGSAFSVHNLTMPEKLLGALYAITGLCAVILGPMVGKLSDRIGKYRTLVIGSLISMVIVVIYTNLGPTPFWLIAVINSAMMVAITSRIIASSALTTAVPEARDRGAFMSVNSSIQQVAGGLAASLAGLIVQELPDKKLLHYNTLGYITVAAMLFVIVMMYFINKMVQTKMAAGKTALQPAPATPAEV